MGHVTVDVSPGGSRRPGGGAFYSALQAARLGMRTLIVTQGVRTEIEELLAPYGPELDVEIHDAPQTTTLETIGDGTSRGQRVLAWAGPIEHPVVVHTAILHFAPVAMETRPGWQGEAEFVGLTPQGLVRTWGRPGGEIAATSLSSERLPGRCDAIVISDAERESCASLIAAVDGARLGSGSSRAPRPAEDGTRVDDAVLAITAAHAPTELHRAGESPCAIEVPPIERFVDDVGAGDVFAAAFFVALHAGSDAVEAAAFGNAAAAVRIAGAGPSAVGERAAIDARVGNAP